MEQPFLLSEVSLLSFVLIGAVALFASTLGGIGGGGAGLMIVPLLVPIVGVKAVVPLMAVSGLLSNCSRVFAFRHHMESKISMAFLLPAIPGAILGASIQKIAAPIRSKIPTLTSLLLVLIGLLTLSGRLSVTSFAAKFATPTTAEEGIRKLSAPDAAEPPCCASEEAAPTD